MKIIFLAWKCSLVIIGLPVILGVSFLVYEKIPYQHYKKYKNEALSNSLKISTAKFTEATKKFQYKKEIDLKFQAGVANRDILPTLPLQDRGDCLYHSPPIG